MIGIVRFKIFGRAAGPESSKGTLVVCLTLRYVDWTPGRFPLRLNSSGQTCRFHEVSTIWRAEPPKFSYTRGIRISMKSSFLFV
jgi:hypothetical protein